MRRIPRVFLGVAAAALLVAGCGPDDGAATGPGPEGGAGSASGAAPKSSAAKAAPLAVAVTGPQKGVAESGADMEEPPGKPDGGADFTTQVEYALQGDLLSDARVAGRTTAVCPHGVTREAKATSACTVTYEGVEIPYTVTIGETYEPDDILTPYRAEPRKRLLVARRVHHEFWERFGGDAGTELSCDEIPVAAAVDGSAPTGYTCQTVRDGGAATRYTVAADSDGPLFDRVQD
ncbi:hypothetical protein [Streptomyces abyssomicinicus]|uniref:hypothetical protein n=1 Tax=Streptomyces abyssomicinicus TaxID=574929 RepID=UPI0012509FE0|nr:hypothetical protein [Streptomyces abyssomicinicus]